MKKISFLQILALSLMIILGFSNTLFGQSGINLPFHSDFSGVGGASDTSSSTMPAISAATMPAGFLFTGSDKIYAGGQKLKFGTANAVGVLPTDVINIGGASTIEVKFNAIAWPTATAKTAKVLLTYGDQSTEITVNGKTGWPVTAGNLIEFSCQFTAIAAPTSLFFKTTASATSNESRIFLDNVRITDVGSSTKVATPTFTPGSGNYVSTQTVTITCATAGATIRYTLDGSDPTESSSLYSTTIQISTQTTLKAKAWKTGLDESNVGIAIYNFPQTVSTLAALRALAPAYINGVADGTTVYTYSGKAVVTQKQTNNNVKYIQDGTAAIMIFDPTGKIQTEIAIRDRITNISGTLTNYYGMIEFKPTDACDVDDYFQNVSPTPISVSQLDDKPDNPIQAKVITINGAYFIQTGNFKTGTYYGLKQNGINYDSVVYTDNFQADYIDHAIPTVLVNLKGVCLFKGSTTIKTKNRIVLLDNANDVVGISNYNRSAIKLAPNPANSYVDILTASPMKLEVYTLLGNLIAIENLSEGKNTISVSNYSSGVYIMKMMDTSTGQLFVQKLVVK